MRGQTVGSEVNSCSTMVPVTTFYLLPTRYHCSSECDIRPTRQLPVLISGTFPYLASIASGGRVQNINGYDIVFTSDAAGLNQLDHEIDSYNPATGAAAFWVGVPLLSHTTDTTIYMWYGNSAVQLSQENKPGVWVNGYVGVWHLTGSSTDSTTNANHGLDSNVILVQLTAVLGLGLVLVEIRRSTLVTLPSTT